MRRLRSGSPWHSRIWRCVVACMRLCSGRPTANGWLTRWRVRPDRPGLAPGWLFATAPPDAEPLGGDRPGRPLRLGSIGSGRRGPNGRVGLARGVARAADSPSWSPDGQALAFGRLVPEDDGRGRFEVVVQEAPDRKRVVLAPPVDEFHARAADLPGLAWPGAPTGVTWRSRSFQQTLAPGDHPRGQRPAAQGDRRCLPARLVARRDEAGIRSGERRPSRSITSITISARPRHLAEIGQTSQAPVWYRDSRSVAIVARGRSSPPRRARRAADRPAPGPHRERPDRAGQQPAQRARRPRTKLYNGSSFSLDRDGDELFYVSDVEGQLTEIIWFRPRTGETAEKFHPIDPMVRLGALALSPSGKTLAFGSVRPAISRPRHCCDLETQASSRPLVPDDAARLEWLATLIRTAQLLLRAHLPATDAQNVPIDRPTLLPVLGRAPDQPRVANRLRRLGRIGRPLCERPADAPPASPRCSTCWPRRGSSSTFSARTTPAALESLEALEARLTTRRPSPPPAWRAGPDLPRAGADRAGRADDRFPPVDRGPDRPADRETPTGLALIREPGRSRRWASYLWPSGPASIAKASEGPAASEMPRSDNRNPDNPEPERRPRSPRPGLRTRRRSRSPADPRSAPPVHTASCPAASSARPGRSVRPRVRPPPATCLGRPSPPAIASSSADPAPSGYRCQNTENRTSRADVDHRRPLARA